MRVQYHIHCNELKHFDEYAGEWNTFYTPGPACAIQIYLPTRDEIELSSYEEWEILFFDDLKEIGLKPGDHIWVEVDY
jgi:hypothetical protein